MRTTRDVVAAHLQCQRLGDLETDLAENYADGVVVITWGGGAHRGRDGVRRLAETMHSYAGPGRHVYEDITVADDYALLTWTARGEAGRVRQGADTLVVRDGHIVAQTTHDWVSAAGTDVES